VTGRIGTLSGTPTVLATAANQTAFRGVAMAPIAPTVSISLKAYLQGAFSTGLNRHKEVTANWVQALNAHALNQPYNVAPFNYAGTESVAPNFFQATAGSTDILDWVLLELRDATTPTTLVASKAVFIREDGQIVGLDGISNPSFTVSAGNYHVVIRHRNHLAIRTATPVAVNASPTLYDFTTALGQAFKNVSITSNEAMVNLSGGTVFGMWAGNANGNTESRASGPNASSNDFLQLVNIILGGNVALIQGPPTGGAPVYNSADMNMDGTVRASGPNGTTNDFLYLVNIILNGNVATIYRSHQ
jgi:hypothetical protein